MSFNRLSTEEIDELKHMVRTELDKAEERLTSFLPNTADAEGFADVRKDVIENLGHRKLAMQSILGKLDRFHQSEVRRYYQPDHYHNNYNGSSNYNNNFSNSSNYNNYQPTDSSASTVADNRYRSEALND